MSFFWGPFQGDVEACWGGGGQSRGYAAEMTGMFPAYLVLHEDGAEGGHDVLLLCLDPRMLLKRALKGLPDLAVKVTSAEAEDHCLELDECLYRDENKTRDPNRCNRIRTKWIRIHDHCHGACLNPVIRRLFTCI